MSPPTLFKILDRRTAIAKALSLAQPGDLVLILGKGAEQLQIIGSKKIPWDDRKVVREILNSISGSSTSKGS
jgi:UDP-N-acetylmuramoyl-L-alanyl-D-glutamate--2,6-diaminopimelate ligase